MRLLEGVSIVSALLLAANAAPIEDKRGPEAEPDKGGNPYGSYDPYKNYGSYPPPSYDPYTSYGEYKRDDAPGASYKDYESYPPPASYDPYTNYGEYKSKEE